jgi:hypothetical protein
MTKGILLFALNNTDVDYTKLAVLAANRAKKFLKVPVSVVTDHPELLKLNDRDNDIDSIITIEDNESYAKRFYDGTNNFVNLQWKNTKRYSSFELSPYDETLVLDVDYFLNSDILSYCWNTPHDFLIYKSGFDLSQTEQINYVSEYSIPFYWATVFYFKKTTLVKHFFSIVQHIKENWNYYRLLYSLPDRKFRNDFAFSIAIHMMNGFVNSNFINFLPGKLYYASDRSHLISIEDNSFKMLLENKDSYIAAKTSGLDVHFMNKFSILRYIKND